MMRLILKYISPLTMLLCLLSIASCRDYGTPGGIENNLTANIVTLVSSSDGVSEFSYRAYDDSPLISLYDTDCEIKDITPGQRIMLQYYDTRLSGESLRKEIDVVGIASTISDTLRAVNPQLIESMVSNPIKLRSIWRTGEFININALLQTTDSTRRLGLLVPKIVESEHVRTVNAYFIDDILNRRAYYYRQAFLSFNTSDFWKEHTECDTLRIFLNDTNFPNVKFYEFTRPAYIND